MPFRFVSHGIAQSDKCCELPRSSEGFCNGLCQVASGSFNGVYLSNFCFSFFNHFSKLLKLPTDLSPYWSGGCLRYAYIHSIPFRSVPFHSIPLHYITLHTYIHLCTYTHANVHIQIHIHVHTCMHACMYACNIYISGYVFVCIAMFCGCRIWMYLRGEGFQGFDGLEVIGYWVGTALDIGPVHAKSPTIVVFWRVLVSIWFPILMTIRWISEDDMLIWLVPCFCSLLWHACPLFNKFQWGLWICGQGD